jgi:UPF0755 protein
MADFYGRMSRAGVPKRVWRLLLALLALMIAGALLARLVYHQDLQPRSSNQATQIFTVDRGSSVKRIAAGLEDRKLIKSAWAFQLYVHSKELGSRLQAGTYAFSPSESVPQIVSTLSEGQVKTNLVTILPGRRIDQVRADLINAGFAPSAVERALKPEQYGDLPALAYKPADIKTLEGLLWPDSFQKDGSTDPAQIIRESLIEMGQRLTPDVQAAFAAEGLTTYKGLILASIIIQEVNKPADQTQAAQVFMSRLKSGSTLGSDVTTRYGAIIAGKSPPNLNYDSPYNTHLHAGLPPAPISSVNASSLTAAAHPAGSSWLYFVAGDDGNTYFSTNLQDHQALTQKYCHKLCGN